ncbi:unnamed protein product [Closterium sp. Naga37s-1]|nr:unnamed protein product [Closterium sp. Naga37s-1]
MLSPPTAHTSPVALAAPLPVALASSARRPRFPPPFPSLTPPVAFASPARCLRFPRPSPSLPLPIARPVNLCSPTCRCVGVVLIPAADSSSSLHLIRPLILSPSPMPTPLSRADALVFHPAAFSPLPIRSPIVPLIAAALILRRPLSPFSLRFQSHHLPIRPRRNDDSNSCQHPSRLPSSPCSSIFVPLPLLLTVSSSPTVLLSPPCPPLSPLSSSLPPILLSPPCPPLSPLSSSLPLVLLSPPCPPLSPLSSSPPPCPPLSPLSSSLPPVLLSPLCPPLPPLSSSPPPVLLSPHCPPLSPLSSVGNKQS